MCLAVPMRVTRIEGKRANVEYSGVSLEVGLDLLPEVQIGDHVVVHAGFAIERLDPEAAEETLLLFEQIAKLS